jgi:hypothetical protein
MTRNAGRSNMKRTFKIGGAVVVGLVVLTLFTLRLVGLEPGYIDPRSEEFNRANRIARPGLWLKGEVVTEPITDWSFVREELRGKTGKDSTIQVETRTWYGIPHSVTIGGDLVRDGKLYIHAHSDRNRMAIPFPNDKAWTRNVDRDPRVRLKIAGKIYKAIVVPVTDRSEGAALLGRDPVTIEKGPDGKEHATDVMHIWRVFQMHVPDYSGPFQGGRQATVENH